MFMTVIFLLMRGGKKSILFYTLGNCFVASLACCVGRANVWLTFG